MNPAPPVMRYSMTVTLLRPNQVLFHPRPNVPSPACLVHRAAHLQETIDLLNLKIRKGWAVINLLVFSVCRQLEHSQVITIVAPELRYAQRGVNSFAIQQPLRDFEFHCQVWRRISRKIQLAQPAHSCLMLGVVPV